MEFSNGYEEYENPPLPPPRPQPPTNRPPPTASSSKRQTAPSLDLTGSPPLPSKRLRQEGELQDDFERLFSKPAVISTAGQARFGVVASESGGASRNGSGSSQQQEMRSRPAAPVKTSSSSTRGVSTSAFTVPSDAPLPSSSASAANGFAKYANSPFQPARPAAASPSSSAIASGSDARPPQQFSTLPSPLEQLDSSSSSSYGHPHPQQRHSNQQASRQRLYPQQYDPQQQQPPQHRQQAPPQSLGRIPIINSAATGRIPSAYLPTSQSQSQVHQAAKPPTKDYYRLQSAAVSAALSAAQGRSTPRDAPPLSSNSGFAPFANGSGKGKGKGKEAPMIDLTTSDAEEDSSDDVIVDDTPICIGQLSSLALILYPVAELQPPPVAPPVISTASGQPIPRPPAPQAPLPVHIYRGTKQGTNETLKLLTPRLNEPFGVMEHNVANVIAPLLGDGFSGTGVQAKSNPGQKVWCEASVVRRGERNPMMLPLQLLLFARPYDVPAVSLALEKSTIYLEHPTTYNPAHHHGYQYSNPHNPAAGVSGRGESERRRMQMLSGIYGGSGLVGMNKAPKTVEVQRQQVEDVFKNLKSGADVVEQEPHPMVTTKLYPHQKQALSFLLDRERLLEVGPPVAGEEDVMVSLWRRRCDIYNRPIGWTNAVTDLEISGPTPPPQSRGSILADDMGLGKTIVVISLVAATLDEAREWAKGEPDSDKFDARFDTGGEKAKKDGRAIPVPAGEFGAAIYGANPKTQTLAAFSEATPGKGLSKKKEAKKKREKKREDAATTRFARLVTRSRGTLIVCPLSTVQNWESQFDEHVGHADGRFFVKPDEDGEEGKGKEKEERALSVYVYHGNTRITDPLLLADYDVVITTFSTLGTEYSKQARAEEEREEEAGGPPAPVEESDDEQLDVFDHAGNLVEKPKPTGKPKKAKRKRKKVEGSGASPLQQIQWFRVVLDEAHIIKEHTTIQARAACDLSASRRTALSGTPLQNSLNDLFSLVRFLRLEPFTDRAVWTQHIGALAKNGDPLGVSRLQLIMRHLALRRTKASVDKDGKPILDLPPNNQKVVHLAFDSAEHAFYSSHHNRYKHDFKKLEESDSVMKNYCSILQELLRLRQICVHMALVRDSEDLAQNGGVNGGGDLVKNIEDHGISKPRAIQLLGLMRDAGGAQCSECGHDMLPVGLSTGVEDVEVDKKPAKKSRKLVKSATASAAPSEDESGCSELKSIITRCQHLFCRACFRAKVCATWPHVKADDRAACSVCRADLTPALDAVEIGARELERALEDAADGDLLVASGKKAKGTRFFEHSTKTKALIADVLPFSQANPASANFWGGMDLGEPKTEATGGTIGFQPVKGEVVKSVVFSQWTKLLDRLGDALDAEKIKYGRLDGGMNRDQRTKAMESFRTDPSCEILLVSLRAGGVGLNLTAARRVYLMEPFWNPAVENQAIDRCHRLGQTMSVQTIRFVIQKSIEENMLKIQQRKTDLANMSLSQTLSKAELTKRRMEDLKTLLS